MNIFNKYPFFNSANAKIALFYIQVFISFIGLGICCWNLINFIKIRLLGTKDFGLYAWTFIFFHPVESGLINYLIVASIFGVMGIAIYLARNYWTRKIEYLIEGVQVFKIIFFLIVSLILLGSIFIQYSIKWNILKSFFIFIIPFFISIKSFFEKKKYSYLLITVLFLFLVFECIHIMAGPAYLMNDYADIFGHTYIKENMVKNDSFLKSLNEGDIDSIKLFGLALSNYGALIDQKTKGLGLEDKEDDVDFLAKYKHINLENAQKFIELTLEDIRVGTLLRKFKYFITPSEKEGIAIGKKESVNLEAAVQNLKNIDIESIKQFFLKNLFENYHQNIGRGQINHIEHVLNPINEYKLGKSIKEIYFQYGIGFTFLKKWVMEFFGGVKIENYYKTYIFYLIYYALTLWVLKIIFPSIEYILASFLIFPICFFILGYIGFFIAPGIIPSIHFFDSTILLLFYLYVKDRQFPYIIASVALSLASAAINNNFGLAMVISLAFSFFFYGIENYEFKKKIYLSMFLIIYFITTGLLIKLLATSNKIYLYYLMGYLSWAPKEIVVLFTFIYLVFSYFFLIYLKNFKFPLKYAYIFVFIYSQIILVYYFWSGLTNHLPPVISFAWIQLIMTIFISKNYIFKDKIRLQKSLDTLLNSTIIIGLILLLLGFQKFYNEKLVVMKNFKEHKVYYWKLNKANLISTMDPSILKESIEIIHKHSNSKFPKIYILSKYDGIIPFLADRYSAMPIFDLSAYIFSKKEFEEAVHILKKEKPLYLFVDRNILDSQNDAWAILYRNDIFKKERAARMSRYKLLADIFNNIKENYEKIDEGGLLSVYRKKN